MQTISKSLLYMIMGLLFYVTMLIASPIIMGEADVVSIAAHAEDDDDDDRDDDDDDKKSNSTSPSNKSNVTSATTAPPPTPVPLLASADEHDVHYIALLDKTMTLAALSQLLSETEGQIIAGPNDIGAYIIGFEQAVSPQTQQLWDDSDFVRFFDQHQ